MSGENKVGERSATLSYGSCRAQPLSIPLRPLSSVLDARNL